MCSGTAECGPIAQSPLVRLDGLDRRAARVVAFEREILFATFTDGLAALYAATPSSRTRVVGRVPGDFQFRDVDRQGRMLMVSNVPRGGVMFFKEGSDEERDVSLARFLYVRGPLEGRRSDPAWGYVSRTTRRRHRHSQGRRHPCHRAWPGTPLALAPDADRVLAMKSGPAAEQSARHSNRRRSTPGAASCVDPAILRWRMAARRWLHRRCRWRRQATDPALRLGRREPDRAHRHFARRGIWKAGRLARWPADRRAAQRRSALDLPGGWWRADAHQRGHRRRCAAAMERRWQVAVRPDGLRHAGRDRAPGNRERAPRELEAIDADRPRRPVRHLWSRD